MKQDEVRNAFPPMPEECREALMRAARSVKEETRMKRFPLRAAVICALALILTMTAALAVTDLLGWTDFYSYEIPRAAREILSATERQDYAVGPITFTVNELMTDGHIALCSATAHKTDGGEAILTTEIFDAIGANGQNGRALAEKMNLPPQTRWIDAARALNRPFYRVDMSVSAPVESDGEDMGDTLWDENGNCVVYYMAALNKASAGDTLPVTLLFQVTEYDPLSVEPADAMEETYELPTELNRWEAAFEISLSVPEPIAEKTYVPPAPYRFSNGMTLTGVQAELTVAGAYVVGQLTLEEGVDFNDVYIGDLTFYDEAGEEIPWGMAESGILKYDQPPRMQWGAMLNMEQLPNALTVTYFGEDGSEERVACLERKE
ncbi:MAG: hypothetical protein IJ662_12485 [Clostridia bacterium]|nr:hypothetical protein [Clostridia bacterium]